MTITDALRVDSIPAEHRPIRIGKLTMIENNPIMLWNDIDVQLTVNEAKIVRVLVDKRGMLASYREIYDTMHSPGFVAGSGPDGFKTNVRSMIKRIRPKFLAIDAAFDRIETKPGYGYRWKQD